MNITQGASTVGVILSRGGVIVATGGCLPGTDQPVMLAPAPGQTLGRIDADLPWHMLISSPAIPASVTLAAMVDLPDEIHPVYQSDTLALTRATGLIDNGTHITADITVTCPLGLGAGLGAVVAVPVDGQTVTGQVESITWTATPDGAIETAVIRRHVAIAPKALVEPAPPPFVADDAAETNAATTTSGNVLANDAPGLTIVAVNGLSARVGQIVAGSNGGVFTIAANGAWTFSPAGDFALLTGSDTATTSVTYHASDGVSEAMGTLTVTVSSSASRAWTPAEISGAVWIDANSVTLNGSTISAATDKKAGTISATQGTAANQPTLVTNVLNGEPVMQFDGNDWLSFGTALGKPANWTVFVVAMFASMGAKTNLCGHMDTGGANVHGWGDVGTGRSANDGKLEYLFGNGVSTYSYGRSTNPVVSAGNWFLCCRRYTNGQDRVVDRVNGVAAAVTKEAGTAISCGGASYQYRLGMNGQCCHYATSGSRLKGWFMTPNAISDADAARLEGYYAHLCGLASLLPSNHPYKSAAPTI
ncbi:MAG TPA: Ig-like domain-containing protein [Dissulfurispiraceae bacterium]|nr:Ig-like domain-containing protein [Dissulfurispiraceae bacterium]